MPCTAGHGAGASIQAPVDRPETSECLSEAESPNSVGPAWPDGQFSGGLNRSDAGFHRRKAPARPRTRVSLRAQRWCCGLRSWQPADHDEASAIALDTDSHTIVQQSGISARHSIATCFSAVPATVTTITVTVITITILMLHVATLSRTWRSV